VGNVIRDLGSVRASSPRRFMTTAPRRGMNILLGTLVRRQEPTTGRTAIPKTRDNSIAWLEKGDEYFAALVDAIAAACHSVRLESYIYMADGPGPAIAAALTAAARRGVQVRVLVDAFGSLELPEAFWNELRGSGGECRRFNPLNLKRITCRNHRKLLVCDETVAFLGGFNISAAEAGDGVTRGWRDLGLRLTGPLAQALAATFDEMFALADFRHPRLLRLRLGRLRQLRLPRLRRSAVPLPQLLTSRPGGSTSPIRQALRRDLAQARTVHIISAYFLPTWRLHRALLSLARGGGDVQIVLARHSDVPLSQLASRSLYHRALHAGIRVFEYQPQVLHTKLIIIDQAVYVGSANLDTRSLAINYELLVRLDQAGVAREAERIFQGYLPLCREIERDAWQASRTLWQRIKGRLAYLVLARLDPYLARRQLGRRQ
jgi:cardiolipin synthase